MEELFELKSHIEHGHYDAALALIGEMEEMSKDDKINKIFSYMEILLIHLIKQHAENRSTRSWEASIRNSVYKINYISELPLPERDRGFSGSLSSPDSVFGNGYYDSQVMTPAVDAPDRCNCRIMLSRTEGKVRWIMCKKPVYLCRGEGGFSDW